MDEAEQYSRRSSVRITNQWEEERDVKPESLVLSLAADMGVVISEADIDRAHRVGRLVPGKPRQILVKFTGYKHRRNFLAGRAVIKSSNSLKGKIFLNEDLTSTRAKMAKDARALRYEKRITNTWTIDGRVIIKDLNGGIKGFNSPKDLSKYINELV